MSWGVKNLSLGTERNWLNHCLLLGLHHPSHQSTTHLIICTSNAAIIECQKLITLWWVARPQRQNIYTDKKKVSVPKDLNSTIPDLGPVSGAVNHQLSSHLHRSPETWPLWSWLVDWQEIRPAGFSHFLMSIPFLGQQTGVSVLACVCFSLCLSLSFSTQNRSDMNSPMSGNVVFWCKTCW